MRGDRGKGKKNPPHQRTTITISESNDDGGKSCGLMVFVFLFLL
jgi:hypothetical protein